MFFLFIFALKSLSFQSEYLVGDEPGVTSVGRVICSVGVRGNYCRRMVKQMWGSRLEEGAGSLLQSAAAVGLVSQSLLQCSRGICAAPVGPVPPCLLAKSQRSMCHRKCRPRSARFVRKHSCRPSHLPHLDCLPHFKGFLSWWASDVLPGRPVTWGQPDRNPDPMSISHATQSPKECLTWQVKTTLCPSKEIPKHCFGVLMDLSEC